MIETPAPPKTLDLSGLPERERLAFYGALFAIAAADNQIDERESDQILESLDLDGLSESARERALAMSIAPPSLQTCLDLLRNTDEALRLGLMLNLVDVALADEEIEPGEPMSLEQARLALGVTPDQVEGMHAYAFRLRASSKGAPLPRPLACPPELC